MWKFDTNSVHQQVCFCHKTFGVWSIYELGMKLEVDINFVTNLKCRRARQAQRSKQPRVMCPCILCKCGGDIIKIHFTINKETRCNGYAQIEAKYEKCF